jgi:hypothetical protein
MATLYRQQIAALCDGLNPDLEADQTTVAQIRGLVDRLTIQSDGGIVVEGTPRPRWRWPTGRPRQRKNNVGD